MQNVHVVSKNTGEDGLKKEFQEGWHIEVDLNKTIADNILDHCAAFSSRILDIDAFIMYGHKDVEMKEGEPYLIISPKDCDEIFVKINLKDVLMSELEGDDWGDCGVSFAKSIVDIGGELLRKARDNEVKKKAKAYDKLQKA